MKVIARKQVFRQPCGEILKTLKIDEKKDGALAFFTSLFHILAFSPHSESVKLAINFNHCVHFG